MRKNKKFLLTLVFFGILAGAFQSSAGGGLVAPAKTTVAVKQYMSKLGSMMAGLEILRLKEKRPDFEAIGITLQEMENTLAEMRKADSTHVYKEYTDMLMTGLGDLKKKNQARDKNVFNALDELTNTCFKCHAAHRPSDFLIPKKDRLASPGK